MTAIKASFRDTWSNLRGLTREENGAMVGGVCEAFGRATPIPAWMWRVGFCAALLGWGAGIIAYIVLMICIPAADDARA
jgi:phage shock protein PspC (stress-responsive transcriptional regulator)